MPAKTQRTSAGVSAFGLLPITFLCLALSACALHWPWHRRHPPPPPVQAVTIVSESGVAATILQYWDRNTLKVDLTALSGEGDAVLTPIASQGWPIRLEFLVRPGSFQQLEVRSAQRVVFEVPDQGPDVLMKLEPGVYAPGTESISLQWRRAADSEH